MPFLFDVLALVFKFGALLAFGDLLLRWLHSWYRRRSPYVVLGQRLL